MKHYEFKNENEYWIAHGPALHFGKAKGAKVLDTGQENLEIFEDKSEWEQRVIELGGDPTENDLDQLEINIPYQLEIDE